MTRLRLAAIAVGLIFVASEARADKLSTCLSAVDAGQSLRFSGKLREARARFITCAAPSCPHVVRTDCARWATEIEASTPTLVVTASLDGHDVSDVSVTIDGESRQSSIDGIALPIDPGQHVIRGTRGSETVEERIVVAEGEKNRKLALTFPSERPAPPVGPPPPSASVAPAGNNPRVLPLVLAGVGTVALGGFAYFGITGKNDYGALERTCAPACTDRQVDAVHGKLLIADIALVVSAVSYASAVVLWLTAPSSTRSSSAKLTWLR